MLHIVLTILAVIGKILLGILGFILLLLLLILLAPIRYRGTFQKQDQEMQAKASVSWLLRFLHVQVTWIEKKLAYEVYVLGIPVFRLLKWIKGLKKNRGKKKAAQKKSGSEEPEALQVYAQNAEIVSPAQDMETVQSVQPEEEEPLPAVQSVQPEEEDSLPAVQSAEGEPAPSAEPVQECEPVKEEREDTRDSEADAEAEAAKPGLFERIRAAVQKVLGIPEKVSRTIRNVADKVKAVCSKAETLKAKVQEILKLLQSRLFKDVFESVKKVLLAIVRHILPQKLWGRVEYGMGDPATTGEILAAIAVIYPILPEKLFICPNFEESILNCDLTLKGRIRLVVLVFYGVKLLLNKKVRRLIKIVRHKEAL